MALTDARRLIQTLKTGMARSKRMLSRIVCFTIGDVIFERRGGRSSAIVNMPTDLAR